MDILKFTCISNFTFVLIFLLFIKYFTKLLFLDNSGPLNWIPKQIKICYPNLLMRRDPLTTFYLTHFLQHSVLQFSKSKQSIKTVQHDLYIKICLEIKFYIFFYFFTIYQVFYKTVVFQWSRIV